jgi:hypothetical membrane protein
MIPEPYEEAWPPRGRYRWYHTFGAVLYVFFCFEIGIILLLLPWLDIWHKNYLADLGIDWYDLWISPYFRGAVSGLGVLDIVISFFELFRLRRFARSRREEDR